MNVTTSSRSSSTKAVCFCAIATFAVLQSFNTRRPDGTLFMRLSGMAVAPNGELYVSDGYSSDYVHRNGKHLKTFGGKKEPYNFNTLHKLAFDTRFTPVRIIAVDRANNRVVHLSLEGDLLGVVAKDMMLPAPVATHGTRREGQQKSRTREVAPGDRDRTAGDRVQ